MTDQNTGVTPDWVRGLGNLPVGATHRATPEREADIHIEKLPNGYWLCRVTTRVPQLPAPVAREESWFHDAGEALVWAEGEIRGTVSHV